MPGPRSTRRRPARAQRPPRPRRTAAARAATDPAAERARRALEDHAHVERLSRMFRALGDPTRSKMVYALSLGELCVSDLAGALGASLSATSHQLRILRDLDIVHVRRDGKSQRYTLNEAAFGFCSPRVCQAWKSALAPGSSPLAGAGPLVRPEEA
jgi:DNA-binding transcriptional ArsR family regulator